MPLLACKCPNCGAELEVDKSNEAAVCKYCDTPFIVEKAINNYNINNNFAGANIIMEDGVSLENLYTLARRALEAEKYEDASNYYHDILKKAPNDWEAIFFINYCKTASCQFNELKSVAKDFANCIPNAVKQITQISDENEQKNAITALSSHSLKLFYELNKAILCRVGDEEKVFNYSIYVNEAVEIMNIGYSLGDALENNNFSDKSSNDIKVAAWKKSLEIIITTYNESHGSWLLNKMIGSEELHKIGNHEEYFNNIFNINEYINRIKKYDSNYVAPAITGRPSPKSNSKEKSGGCYIATCVYGSYDCPEVWTLRRFRDNYLSTMWYGKIFVKIYYLISPHIVKYFGKNNCFKKIWKISLDKLVIKLQKAGYINTPYSDK